MNSILAQPTYANSNRWWVMSRQTVADRLLFVGLLLLLRIALDTSYVFFVTPIFDYAGLSLHVDLLKLAESYILFLSLAFIVPCHLRKPSDLLETLLFLFPVFATLSFYGLNDQNRAFTYMIVFAFLVFVATRRTHRVRLPSLRSGRVIAIVLASSLVAFVLASMIGKGGLGQMTLQLGNELYEYRESSGGQFAGGLMGYLNTWVFKVFNIVLMVWALSRRHFLIVAMALALQMLFFAIMHAKAILFFPVIVFGIYFGFRKRNTMNIIVLGLLAMVGVSVFVSYLTDSILLPSLFIRRIFYLPAQMNFAYYEFFSMNGLVYMSNSVFSFLSEYPYAYIPPNLIGDFVYGTPETNANTGFLATGYMHFGFAGMIIFSAITGLLVRMVDSLVVGRLPNWLGLAIVIVPFWSLFLSSDLSTALLTHGIIPGLVMLWLFGTPQFTKRRRFKQLNSNQAKAVNLTDSTAT